MDLKISGCLLFQLDAVFCSVCFSALVCGLLFLIWRKMRVFGFGVGLSVFFFTEQHWSQLVIREGCGLNGRECT